MIAILMCVALVFSFLAFRAVTGMSWHVGIALFLAAMPLGLTFFFGILGLIFSALFVGALYKAASAAP